MQMFDFFSRDEMRGAPADPEEAFIYLVELAYKRLSSRAENFNFDDDWHEINEARHGFINVVVGLAKNFKVEPIASMFVPTLRDYGDVDYRQFKTDLDHYLVQLVGKQIREEREDSIALIPATKERVRTYLHHIRTVLDKAEIDDKRRRHLLGKLSEFEAALEGNRVSLAQVMKFVMGMSVTGLALADSQTLNRLVSSVVEVVAEVHAIEDEQRQLPPPERLIALLPPRPAQPKAPKDSFSADLDDEIPF